MDLYTAIIFACTGAICFLAGVLFEALFDNRIINDQRRYISKLKYELSASIRENERLKNTREVKFVELAGHDNPANNVQFGG